MKQHNNRQHNVDQILDDLQSSDVLQPEYTARKQAINLANQSFDQAFSEPARLKNKSTDSLLRSFIMSIFSKQPLSPGFSVAFGVLAVTAISIPLLTSYDFTSSTPNSVIQNYEPSPSDNSRLDDTSKIEFEEIVVTSQRSESNKGSQQSARVNDASADSILASPVADSKMVKLKSPKPMIQRPEITAESTAQVAPKSRVNQRVRSLDELAYAAKPVEDFSRSVISPAPSIVQLEEGNGLNKQRPDTNEEYAEYQRNSVTQVSEQPISTFSADVDTASYSLVRNQLNRGYLPAQQAVRAEEFINYFDYGYPVPASKKQPFQPTVSVLDSPWNEGKKLVHIGIKGYDISEQEAPDSNIVFLMDVSGSMSDINKLPLAKQAVHFLANQLKPTDKISIAVYAGAAGVVLEPTDAKDKTKLSKALNSLNAGGSTAGGAGIELAYSLAAQHFDKDAVNRIVLLTDGDFNVGQSSNQALQELVERKRKNGVFLSVLGFGRNNYQDDMMQTLAQNGNGIAAYIDTLSEAKKVLVDEATSSLFPIAKDVKFQVEFNPGTVSDYRLIGYETRALKTEDFNNDKVDAGDIGAGHTVTAIYEITPADADKQSVDQPRYSANKKPVAKSGPKGEYGYLKMRYKLPNENKSKLIETAIKTNTQKPSLDTQFSIAVAGFAQLLSGSTNIGDLDYKQVAAMAKSSKGEDAYGYRAEFIRLAEMAELAQ